MIILAGGIGSGKSVVARIIRLEGFGVFDCDSEARVLMERDVMLKRKIVEIAGEYSYDSQGRINRRWLASRIFDDALVREKVNTEVHRAIREKIEEWLTVSPGNIFVETAIAAESGILDMANRVWMVECSLATRIQRVKRRDGRSEKEISAILEAQKREEQRIITSGIPVTLINNSDDADVLKQVKNHLQHII